MKKCPYCSQEIQDNAKKCWICGEWLDAEKIFEGKYGMPQSQRKINWNLAKILSPSRMKLLLALVISIGLIVPLGFLLVKVAKQIVREKPPIMNSGTQAKPAGLPQQERAQTTYVEEEGTVIIDHTEAGKEALPSYGEVIVTSDPPGANLVFDGRIIPSETPISIRKVPTNRDHQLTLNMKGYISESVTFRMDSGKKEFKVKLTHQY